MDKEYENLIFDSLDSVREALERLQYAEDQQLRQLVSTSRRQVTKALEDLTDCSLEHRIDISHLPDEDWLRTAYHILGEIFEPLQVRNSVDRDFQKLLDYIWSHSVQELFDALKNGLEQLKRQSQQDYNNFVSYFSRFPLWGTLDPVHGDYTTLRLRASVLKQHSYDFLWLYCRMEDYLSRRTLYAVLANWALWDFGELNKVKSIFPDYWEPDIFPDNIDDVFVDVGAYTGDSIMQYVKMYGTGYRKIYAYEISDGSCTLLRKNVKAAGLHDVIVRQKGAGQFRSEMFVNSSKTDSSANQLSQTGSGQDRVAVVPLDEDITGNVTFLKMDIEGAEQSALLGCERIIREMRPKLAICTYHGYEDIWKIPVMIDCMYPEYRFYMRHYGGNLIPTEFVLLCNAY